MAAGARCAGIFRRCPPVRERTTPDDLDRNRGSGIWRLEHRIQLRKYQSSTRRGDYIYISRRRVGFLAGEPAAGYIRRLVYGLSLSRLGADSRGLVFL